MTINQQQDRIIEDFEGVYDWMDRYSMIIDLGNTLPPIEEKYITPDNLIEGFLNRVWRYAYLRYGKVFYT